MQGILGMLMMASTILMIIGLVSPHKLINNPNVKYRRLIIVGAWIVVTILIFVYNGITKWVIEQSTILGLILHLQLTVVLIIALTFPKYIPFKLNNLWLRRLLLLFLVVILDFLFIKVSTIIMPNDSMLGTSSSINKGKFEREIAILQSDSIEIVKLESVDITSETGFQEYKSMIQHIDSLSKPLVRIKKDSTIINNPLIASLCLNNTNNAVALRQRMMENYRPYLLHEIKEKYNSRTRNVTLSTDGSRLIFYDRSFGASNPSNRRAIVKMWSDKLLLAGITFVDFDFGDNTEQKETRMVKTNEVLTTR